MVVAVVAGRTAVKTVKTALQQANLFARTIVPAATSPDEQHFLLHTNVHRDDAAGRSHLRDLLPGYQLSGVPAAAAAVASPAASPLTPAVAAFIAAHPPAPPLTTAELLATAPRRYSHYPPLLLLAANAFPPPWRAYLASLPAASTNVFYAALTGALPGTTHVALNAPIPADSTARAPVALTPLHGDFSSNGFEQALWVRTTQHGVTQTWAPVHTMFSRGNVREKARVQAFPGVMGAVVADLYAGIGYFALAYLRAGARLVWAWEINPWSVEALVRGCKLNGWGVRRVRHDEAYHEEDGEGDVRCIVFEESNEYAVKRLRGMEKTAHVNLGLLPTSRGAWAAAAELVSDGGCIHVHENVGAKEVQVKKKEVMEVFVDLEKEGGRMREVRCEHVEQVKTFAPGVVHCVLDLRIG